MDAQQWRKFGDCEGLPPGPEKVITTVGDEVFLELKNAKAQKAEKEKEQAQEDKVKVGATGANKDVVAGIVCRFCQKQVCLPSPRPAPFRSRSCAARRQLTCFVACTG